jgi:hypothetical protein
MEDIIKIHPDKTMTAMSNCPSDCSDLDDDCEDIENKVRCWLHAPEKGMCPWLREERK